VSDVLLDPAAIGLALQKIANELVERSRALGEPPILVAIRRGGDPFAKRIAQKIEAATGTRPAIGAVDITLYRDDAATQLPNPRIGPSRLPVPIDRRWVVLVDDVISSGRTIRAALDAVLDFGRPSRIELAVLVDRGGRELPIQPDYAGLKATVDRAKRVEVMLKRTGPAEGDEEPWAILVPPNPMPSSPGTPAPPTEKNA
jgi:pyrimidine operon attenuation protein/uracil phosphoribosyltransferase